MGKISFVGPKLYNSKKIKMEKSKYVGLNITTAVIFNMNPTASSLLSYIPSYSCFLFFSAVCNPSVLNNL